MTCLNGYRYSAPLNITSRQQYDCRGDHGWQALNREDRSPDCQPAVESGDQHADQKKDLNLMSKRGVGVDHSPE